MYVKIALYALKKSRGHNSPPPMTNRILFLQISFYSAYINVHTKFHASTLPRTALKVSGGGGHAGAGGTKSLGDFSVQL